jgi:large subunit ribosomal protein L10
MENPRPAKVAVVDEVRDRLSSADAALLTEYRGLNVGDISRLRQAVTAAGGSYKIYKNTLVRLAVREMGLEDLVPLLEGPTAIAFVDGDAALVAKALRDFARGNPSLVVKGGVLGSRLLTGADAGALAELPSRDELLARIAGALAAPMQQFAGLLQAVPLKFAYAVQALIDQKGGIPAEAATEPEPEATAAPEPEPEVLAEATGEAAAESGAPAEAEPEESGSPEDGVGRGAPADAPEGADARGDSQPEEGPDSSGGDVTAAAETAQTAENAEPEGEA